MERHLEFKEGSMSERGDKERVTWRRSKKLWPI